MLHAALQEGRLQTLIGALQRIQLGIAHTSGIECAKGRVTLLQQPLIQLSCRCIVAIQQPGLGSSTIDENVGRILQHVLQRTDDAILRLIASGIGQRESGHNLAIHRIVLQQPRCPVLIGAHVGLLPIAVSQLSESLMRQTVLGHILQQFRCLPIVGTFVLTICQFQSDLTGNTVFGYIRL